jgi:hypothetical protein
MNQQGQSTSDAEGANTPPAPASAGSRAARWIFPFVVSVALLWFVFSGIDISAVLERMTLSVALRFVPPLLAFVAFTLWIEALCLVRVIAWSHPFDDKWVAAKIKSASYLLGLVNYALGAGALTVLVRRRVGMNLATAAGSILLISLLDLLSLLLLAVLGMALMGTGAPALQAGIVLGAGGAIVLGFAVLRAPAKLGPLDRLRDLQLFSAARSAPISLLLELGALRIVFVGSFVSLAWATVSAFDISIPLLPMMVNTAALLLIAALPIAVAGLGTGQLAFVTLFERYADADALLAASLTLSFGLIVTRSLLGLLFAREYTSEAIAAEREGRP